MPKKRPINVRVSEDAADGWALLCENNGVTKTGIIEALGLYFNTISGDLDRMSKVGKDIIATARRIDAQRLRRPR